MSFDTLRQFVRETAQLTSVVELLGWDERTMLPDKGGEFRADQMSLLAGLAHQRRTDPRLGEWLSALAGQPVAADPNSDAGATIRQIKRRYDKDRRVPQSLVEALTKATVLGQQAWVTARKENNFASFVEPLTTILKLTRDKADALGWTGCRYDALLDEYEPEALTADVRKVLEGLRKELVPLVAAIVASPKKPDVSVLKRSYPVAAQESFGREAARLIGFDFERGRLDVTAHPFCTTLGPHDCRITTRYDERFFPMAFFGILHEAGHGIYEQGLRPEWFGLPPGEALSLGIHESQSRMWENLVGRSRAFWRFMLPKAAAAFPEALVGVGEAEFYAAINEVRPSLIRVEADEVTYNLHILIRFELEQALMDGDLSVADLPGAWREKYQAYLGIEPPTDANGCLQDVHWSAGLIGYFATYSLGNLYAAQFFDQARADLGDLEAAFAAGEFASLRAWLRTNIHARGQCLPATKLVETVTGKPLSHEPLMRYLRGKFGPLYGLAASGN